MEGAGEPRSELEQLQYDCNRVTDDSLESTRRMLALCEESKEAGIRTLVALDDQGEQIERIEEGMDQINADMKEAEKNLSGMEKCCGLCVLPCQKLHPSHYPRSSHFKEETLYVQYCIQITLISLPWIVAVQGRDPLCPALYPNYTYLTALDRYSSRKRPSVPSIVSKLHSSHCLRSSQFKEENDPWKDKGDGVVNSQPQRVNAGNGSMVPGLQVGRITKEVREDEMEENLGQVNTMIDNLRNMATDMSSEIDNQNRQLDRLNSKSEVNTSKIKTANDRTGKLLK
ncbi:Target SNARE coiled-coil domain [Trinorchestia longiramus]|nr:Target SNARE coiled-coil domain [Trinorchestia longiramus]